MLDRIEAPEIRKLNQLKISRPGYYVLSNGLPVYQFTNDSYNAMRLDLIFNAGSAFQKKMLEAGTTNIMLRESNSKWSSQRLSAKLDYHGSYIDLSIDKDNAWLTLFCLRKNFNYLLPLIRSMVTTPRFSPNDFLLVNSKQKNTFAINDQKPRHIARKLFNKKIFGENTPYGQIAELTDFDKLSVDNLKQFYRQYYHFGNCRMIVSGPVNDKHLARLEDTFGDEWGYHDNIKSFDQHTDFTPGIFRSKLINSLQSAIFMGKPLVNREHPDFPKLLVLNTVFGGYFGSRLMSNIREDKGYTYGIYSQIAAFRKAAIMQIITEVGAEATQATLDEIFKEINRLRHEVISTEELTLVKNYLYGQFLRSLDGPYALAERLKTIIDLDEGMDYYERSYRGIQDVDAEELLEMARTYLDPEAMLTVVVGRDE